MTQLRLFAYLCILCLQLIVRSTLLVYVFVFSIFVHVFVLFQYICTYLCLSTFAFVYVFILVRLYMSLFQYVGISLCFSIDVVMSLAVVFQDLALESYSNTSWLAWLGFGFHNFYFERKLHLKTMHYRLRGEIGKKNCFFNWLVFTNFTPDNCR